MVKFSALTNSSSIKPTVLICLFGFFMYVKPSEPFLTAYLMGPIHNLTAEEVVSQVFPTWIYAYLAFLVPAFLLTDYLKYKPVIVFQGLGAIACWLLLLFGRGVPLMQLMEVCYAVVTAAEIGYYSYIYSIVDKSQYQRVTSYVRSATLFGYFCGSLLGQLLVSLADLDYFYLNIISLVNVSIAFIVSLFLPMPKSSLFFSPIVKGDDYANDEVEANTDKISIDDENGSLEVNEEVEDKNKRSLKASLLLLKSDIIKIYKDFTLLRWSIWWALSACGYLLVVNYIQNLWETIRPSSEYVVYNGAVESAATALGALGAMLVGYVEVNWSKFGELSLGIFSFANCGLLITMYFTEDIWVCYGAYTIFTVVYHVCITITQFQIAVGLSTRRFALVFGVNLFAGLALNTLLTVILIDQAGLALDVNTQFVVYSGYFGVIGLVFFSHAFYVIIGAKDAWSRGSEVSEQTAVIKTAL